MKDRTPRILLDTGAGRPPEFVYPFTAIVGQPRIKLALVLNAIDPSIGGVLIMGHRGTGKSTAVRGLADLLPKLMKVRNCRYGCDPLNLAWLCVDCNARVTKGEKLTQFRERVSVIDLPLGATEDRVCGTIDIERAFSEGVKSFEPGLLARANRGFLYIDEVNLLEDHLVDLLLDVSVTGRNVVEREGVSIVHPSRFVLVATGNPEEGELRPQLVDRFGLSVDVTTETDVEQRMRIVQRRQAFDLDPEGFCADYEREQKLLKKRLTRARSFLKEVDIPTDRLRTIAEICSRLKIDGHRGELTIARAARALASLAARSSISDQDISDVAAMCLRHRLRRDPFDGTSGTSGIDRVLDDLLGTSPDQPSREHSAPGARSNRTVDPQANSPSGGNNGDGGTKPGRLDYSLNGTQDNFRKKLDREIAQMTVPRGSLETVSPEGRGMVLDKARIALARNDARRSRSGSRRGRYAGAVVSRPEQPRIAVDATLRATATRIMALRTAPVCCTRTMNSTYDASSLRYKRLSSKIGKLFLFVIDASGSMARDRISQAKGALVSLLRRSYINRDEVALIAFRGEGAEVLLHPSRSTTRARRLLDSIAIGGATPLSAGLLCSLDIARKAARESQQRISLLIFTDGGANLPLTPKPGADRQSRTQAIDMELKWLGSALHELGCVPLIVESRNPFTSNGEVAELAAKLRGRVIKLRGSDLSH